MFFDSLTDGTFSVPKSAAKIVRISDMETPSFHKSPFLAHNVANSPKTSPNPSPNR